MPETKPKQTNVEILRSVYSPDSTRLQYSGASEVLFETEFIGTSGGFAVVTNKKIYNPANLNYILARSSGGVYTLKLSPTSGDGTSGTAQSNLYFTASSVNDVFVDITLKATASSASASIITAITSSVDAGANLEGLTGKLLGFTFTCKDHANAAIEDVRFKVTVRIY